MDLFQDFSFSKAAQSIEQNVIDGIGPADISPRSSRDSSPFSSASSYFSPEMSLMDLSNTTEPFPAYDLNDCPSPAYPSTPISSRLQAVQRKRSNAQNYFETIRQRRQSAVRLQCNPKNAASIRNYVERFLSQRAGTPSSRHPSCADQPYQAPPTSAPRDDFNLVSTDSSSEEDEAEAFKSLSIADGPSSSDRRTSGSVAPGRRKSYAVQKKSRGAVKSSGRF